MSCVDVSVGTVCVICSEYSVVNCSHRLYRVSRSCVFSSGLSYCAIVVHVIVVCSMYESGPSHQCNKSDMDDAKKEALRRRQDDLRTGIIVNNILPSLHKYAGGFLDDVEEDRVKSKEGNVAQVDELLVILRTKEDKDFNYFCTIIEKNNATRASNLRKAAEIGK